MFWHMQISNTEGELYSLSIRSPQFKWIQDLSSFDKLYTITPGNNGILYVTVPVKSLILALDVSSGNVLWQTSIGQLSSAESSPVVDSYGQVLLLSLLIYVIIVPFVASNFIIENNRLGDNWFIGWIFILIFSYWHSQEIS